METRRVVRLGLLVALGSVLHAAETLLPSLGIPGAKLGLANIVTLTTLSQAGLPSALVVSVARVILGSLVTGTFFSVAFWMALAGATVSALVMGALLFLWPRKISLVGRSIAGAASHNLAQLAVAMLVVRQSGVMVYLPYLLLFAIPTGYFIGLVARYLQPYLGRDEGPSTGGGRQS